MNGAARSLVLHFGDRPGSPGGMASVLADYAAMDVPGHCLRVVPTYDAARSAHGLRLMPGALLRLLTAPRSAIVHLHLSERGSFVREGGLARVARARGMRVVMTLHGAELPQFAARRPGLVRSVLETADRVVCLADPTQEVVERLLPGRPVVRMVNPAPVRDVGRPAGRTVVFAGAHSRRKGLDVLLEAWRGVQERLPDAELVLVGPSGDVQPDGSPGVRELGPQPRERVLALICESAVCVLPSRHEVLPVFLLEAMGHGRPVVTTPVGGIPDLVGAAGALVPVGDAEALRDALLELLLDADLLAARGAAARARVEATHSASTVASALARLYDDLPGRPRGRGSGGGFA